MVQYFERSIIMTDGVSAELIETDKEGNRFYKVDSEGNSMFWLGVAYGIAANALKP